MYVSDKFFLNKGLINGFVLIYYIIAQERGKVINFIYSTYNFPIQNKRYRPKTDDVTC